MPTLAEWPLRVSSLTLVSHESKLPLSCFAIQRHLAGHVGCITTLIEHVLLLSKISLPLVVLAQAV
jgi:hypothetical protein